MALSNKETEITQRTSMSFPAHKYTCLPLSFSLHVILFLLTLSCPFLFLILSPFLYFPLTLLHILSCKFILFPLRVIFLLASFFCFSPSSTLHFHLLLSLLTLSSIIFLLSLLVFPSLSTSASLRSHSHLSVLNSSWQAEGP